MSEHSQQDSYPTHTNFPCLNTASKNSFHTSTNFPCLITTSKDSYLTRTNFPCLNIPGNYLVPMLDYTSQLWTLPEKIPTPNTHSSMSGHCQKWITPMLDFPILNTISKTLNPIRNYISHIWRLPARIPIPRGLHFPRLNTYKDSNLICYFNSKFLYKYPAPCCRSS